MLRLPISIFTFALVVVSVGKSQKRNGKSVLSIIIISHRIKRKEKFVKDVRLTKVWSIRMNPELALVDTAVSGVFNK